MKNNFAIFIYVLIVLPGSNSCLYAQQQPSNGEGDTVQLPAGKREYNGDNEDTIYLNVNDTIEKFRRSREFRYMNRIDSILRSENDLRRGTARLNKSRNTIIRKKAANDFSSANRILNSTPMQVFFWTLAFLFITLISYRLFFKNSILKRKAKFTENIEDERPQELADASTYEALIREAEEAGNYNLAIRYLFLRTLTNLKDKGLISFDASKTNRQYLNEVNAKSGPDRFEFLVYHYEYAWYGKFPIDANTYRYLKKEFQLFNEKVQNN
jgi:hypothetical protein